jgi:hypothetical protein
VGESLQSGGIESLSKNKNVVMIHASDEVGVHFHIRVFRSASKDGGKLSETNR